MNSRRTNTTPGRTLLQLLPLLAVYFLSALWQTSPNHDGDGWRYLIYARNVLDGFFASPDSLMFWNGPGFPLFILPWVALGWSMVWVHLANALVLWLAVFHAHQTLQLWGCGRRSLWYAYGLGLVMLLHGSLMGAIMSECLSAYFASGAIAFYAKATAQANQTTWTPSLWLASIHLAGLALTKVFFGYVLEACLVAAGLVWILCWALPKFHKRVRLGVRLKVRLGLNPSVYPGIPGPRHSTGARAARQSVLICGLALLFCLPWLTHTYVKTGKWHLWSNSGGWQIWYMTWPEPQYHGDWLNWQAILEQPEFFAPHLDELKSVLQFDVVTQDSILKAWSWEAIQKHPKAYFTHWRANVNRMVFGYPTTRFAGGGSKLTTGNRAFIYALPFFLLVILAWPGWRARQSMPLALWGILTFALVALVGTSLLSAIPRQVFPLLPMLWLPCCLAAEKGLSHADKPVIAASDKSVQQHDQSR